MKRAKEEFLDRIEEYVPLVGKLVLEVGCGTGSRSIAIAERCKFLEAIEPDESSLKVAARDSQAKNINFQKGEAQEVPFSNNKFDVIIFTLSLHHVPITLMEKAIDEAVRVSKIGGHVIFLEPAFSGSYFDAEINFGAGDGDERADKARAYFEILNYKNYTEIIEIDDETIFKLDSEEDFTKVFNPKKNLDKLPVFLNDNNFILNAMRRINIYRV